MALFTEAWLPYIIPNRDEFFSNRRFLSHGVNMNAFVENDKIHMAYKGGRRTIVKNFKTNGTTTLPFEVRTDIPDEIVLDNYSTAVSVIPADDMMRLPYDKKVDMFMDDRESIADELTKEGMHKIAPVNSVKTPVILVPNGNTVSLIDSYRIYTRDDFKVARAKLDEAYPGRMQQAYWCFMDVVAYLEFISNDDILKTQYGNIIGGMMGKIFDLNAIASSELPPINIHGIWIYPDSRNPWYVDVDTKVAYGAAPTVGAHLKGAVIYVANDTFATALGTISIFDNTKDPAKQADLWSLLQRAYIGPKGVTAANFTKAAAILRTPQ